MKGGIYYHESLAHTIVYNHADEIMLCTSRANAAQNWKEEASGPRLNIKTVLSAYGVFHVKDKTAVRTSYL